MQKKFFKQITIGLVAATTLFATLAPSFTGVVSANELKSEEKVTNSSLTTEDLGFLLSKGATISEINSLSDSDKTITNGVVEGAKSEVDRGKFSSAAKILIANYSKLPGWVKGIIGYGTANAIAKKLEQLNGNLTDALTIAIQAVGFSPGVARSIAQAIAFALF